MTVETRGGSSAERVARWSARALGTSLAIGWLLIGTASALSGDEPFTLESLFMVAFSSTTVTGAALAWRFERLGGTVLLCGGLAFAVFAFWSAGRNKVPAALIAGGPMDLAGVLHLVAVRSAATRRSKRTEGSAEAARSTQ